MKRPLLAGVAMLAAASLSACNFQLGSTPEQGSAKGGGANSGTPAPAAPAQPAAGGGDAGGAPSAAVQAAARQNFTVNNQTGHTVITLQVSASSETNWGPDILGSQVLPNGQSAEVSFDRAETSCLWDMRATFDDGTSGDWRQINLCEVGTVNLTPS